MVGVVVGFVIVNGAPAVTFVTVPPDVGVVQVTVPLAVVKTWPLTDEGVIFPVVIPPSFTANVPPLF